MVKENVLVKIYSNKFNQKAKYKISDFVDITKLNITSFASGYKAISEENKFVEEDLKELEIPSFMKKDFLLTKDLELCAQYLYLDLYILIQQYNLKLIDIKEFKKEIYSYFSIHRKNIVSNSKNKTFLVSNKQSIELPRDKALYPSLERYRVASGFLLLEVPFDFKRKETFSFLKEVISFLENIGLKGLKTNFRIRKIHRIKRNGMFIVNANTLVIDPRNPEKVLHEIGHYIYENGLAFNLDGKRIYKNRFDSIIKKNQHIAKIDISNYEDYEKNSEIFAYWFEKQFKDKK